MSLSMYHLLIFRTIYECGSISLAAEKLFVSQSAVSHQLRLLENHFAIKLFERQGRTIKPTKAGKLVYDYVTEILDKYNELVASVKDLQKGRAGNIVIAGSIIPGTYLLPSIVGRFRKEHPEISLQLNIYTTDILVQNVLNGKLDFGIVTSMLESERLVYEKIRKEKVIIIAAPNTHDEKIPLSKEELAEKPFICIPKEMHGRINYDTLLAEHGIIRKNVAMEVGHPEGIKQAVRAGLGLGIMHRFAVERELKQGALVEIKVEGVEMYGDIFLVHRPYKNFLPIEEKIINFIKQETALYAV